MSLADRSYMGEEAERVPGVPLKTKVTTPPGPPPVMPESRPEESPNARRLWQFNLTHPHLPGTVSVTVYADIANARGLAYLVAEEFCQQIIGHIKAE